MPIYCYYCEECDCSLEKLQNIHDESLAICEECGEEMERVPAVPTVRFKGSGFYETDYKDKTVKI